MIKMVEIKVVSLEIPTVEALRVKTKEAKIREENRRKEIEEQSWDNFPNLIQAIFKAAQKNADKGYSSCYLDIAASEEFKIIDPRIDYVFEGLIENGMTEQIEKILTETGYNVKQVYRFCNSSYRSMTIRLDWFEN